MPQTTAMLTTAQPGKIRSHIVKPRSSGRETALFLLVMALIVMGMTGRFMWVANNESGPVLQPYQQLDTTLNAAERTFYRHMAISVPEIIDARNREGLWPEALLLEMNAIPPFDRRFLPQMLAGYQWLTFDGGAWVDYLANDASGTSRASLILRLIDLHAGYHPHPHPGVDYDPDIDVAMQIWYYPDPQRPYPGERLPEAGWYWLLSPDDPLLVTQTVATGSE